VTASDRGFPAVLARAWHGVNIRDGGPSGGRRGHKGTCVIAEIEHPEIRYVVWGVRRTGLAFRLTLAVGSSGLTSFQRSRIITGDRFRVRGLQRSPSLSYPSINCDVSSVGAHRRVSRSSAIVVQLVTRSPYQLGCDLLLKSQLSVGAPADWRGRGQAKFGMYEQKHTDNSKLPTMSVMTFVASLVSTLAWPLIVLAVALIFRQQLAKLVQNLA
jgi:hypothetical protein